MNGPDRDKKRHRLISVAGARLEAARNRLQACRSEKEQYGVFARPPSDGSAFEWMAGYAGRSHFSRTVAKRIADCEAREQSALKAVKLEFARLEFLERRDEK